MIHNALSKKEIVEILKNNGLESGMIVEVHCSLSSLGYVIGGAQTIVDALMEVVGYHGTILMAMQSSQNTEPGKIRRLKVSWPQKSEKTCQHFIAKKVMFSIWEQWQKTSEEEKGL